MAHLLIKQIKYNRLSKISFRPKKKSGLLFTTPQKENKNTYVGEYININHH
jgi:hypothetical protein